MSYKLASQGNKGLRALDPDLPFLASEAAIDIDNLLSNRDKNLTAMRCLAERLKNSIKLDSTDGTSHSLMDLATLTLLGEAMAEAVRNNTFQKIEDLVEEAADVAKLLSSDDPAKDLTELEKARDFCMALARAVMAYRKSIRDMSPSHPFRR